MNTFKKYFNEPLVEDIIPLETLYQELLLEQRLPLWGAVSNDLAQMATKLGFIRPPVFMIKLLMKSVPPTVFGTESLIVNSDGSVSVPYSDVGTVKKYFIVTPQYFYKLLKEFWFKIPTLLKKHINNLLHRKTVNEYI